MSPRDQQSAGEGGAAVVNSSALDWSTHLETVSKSNELANQNLVQQNSITYQQALSQIAITGISKCFELISQIDPNSSDGSQKIEMYRSMIDQFNEMVQTASLVAAKTVHIPSEL